MFSVNNMQIKLILSMLLLSLMIVTLPVHTKVQTIPVTKYRKEYEAYLIWEYGNSYIEWKASNPSINK